MNSSQVRPLAAAAPTSTGLNLYLLFAISWFLHLPARLEFLGAVRFDLLLVCILAGLALTRTGSRGSQPSEADKVLRVLIAYVIVTIPFVYWPGSVLKSGLPDFIKAIVFFYFTIAFVRTKADLKKFVFVFVAVQIVRILEPLYLNFTQDYWGSRASMANWESMNRLSGAPSDVINPNGLAFVVCTVLPFLYFLAGQSLKIRVAAMLLAPLCLYALFLTGSRTGFLALIVIVLSILVKSKKRFLLGLTGVLVVVIGFPFLSANLQDRYLSTFGSGDKNIATVEERLEGMRADIEVALRRPLFGHGLGTSREANANFGERDQPAHNLYIEVAQELGIVGLVIFLFFLKSIFSGFAECKRAHVGADTTKVLPSIVDAMRVWLWMNLLFSFASYGLNSYEWYLLGGFSIVMRRLAVAPLAKEVTRQAFK